MNGADVVVVGGGVSGLACSWELARAGASVIVFEALPAPGQASSSRANGGVRAQFTTAPNIAFSLHSIAAYEELERRTGLLSFHQTGYLLMSGTPDGVLALRAAVELQRSLGVPTEWLEPAEVIARVPFVRADGLLGATMHGRDGFLDPAGVVAAFTLEAKGEGAEIRTRSPVTAITREGTAFLVRSPGGDASAGLVVNAAGADARAVAAMLDADVPVEPVRRNLALFLDPGGDRTPTPMCVDLDTGVLARREVSGGWVAAYSSPSDRPGRDTSVDPAFFEDLAERIPNRFPFLEDLPIDPDRCWAGLYPETPDHHAIVGADPGVPGLLHCAGFGGHGIMHAPAAGRAIAELATTGRCGSFDLHPLRPSRFAEGDLVVEANVF